MEKLFCCNKTAAPHYREQGHQREMCNRVSKGLNKTTSRPSGESLLTFYRRHLLDCASGRVMALQMTRLAPHHSPALREWGIPAGGYTSRWCRECTVQFVHMREVAMACVTMLALQSCRELFTGALLVFCVRKPPRQSVMVYNVYQNEETPTFGYRRGGRLVYFSYEF